MSNAPTRVPHAEALEDRRLLSLTPGNPVTVGTPVAYSGVGGTNTDTAAGSANAALTAFETAVGGANNGATASPQTGGFRNINWDAVKLDGTDFGGSTTVINQGKTVGIPLNRFQERGVSFAQVYAVSNDGFADVNPAAAGLFHAFSPNNTFVMFNDNAIDFSFVQPSSHTTSPVPAEARGFGAIFLNVQTPNTTSIEFFHGSQSLGKFFVPVGTAGQPEFLGELFANPIVTNVTLTLGTDVLFTFNGTTAAPGAADAPAATPAHNIAATDDFVYPEPVAAPDLPAITGTQGQTFSGVVARFSDSDTAANAKSFTGTIDWGDGQTTPATFAANSRGGFDVSGTHTFATGGTLPVNVRVQQFNAASDEITLTNLAKVTPLPVYPVFPKGVNVNATAGTSFTAVVARFTTNTGAQTNYFTANIDWGDGTTSAGTVASKGKSFVVTGTHTYSNTGTDTIKVTVTNAGGTSYTATAKAKVKKPRGKHGKTLAVRAREAIPWLPRGADADGNAG
jgi:hypothetical protein